MSFRSLLPTLAFVCLSFTSFSQTTGNCEERETTLIEGLGAHAAVCLYTNLTFLNTVYTGYTGNGITHHDAQQKVKIIIAFLEELVKTNKALMEKGLKDELDVEFVKKSIEIYESMKAQANAFFEYTKTDSEEKVKTYKKLDEANWKKVNLLLGLEE